MDINWTLVLGIVLALVSLALFMAYAYRAGYDDAVEDEDAWWDEYEDVMDEVDEMSGEEVTLDVQNAVHRAKTGGLGE